MEQHISELWKQEMLEDMEEGGCMSSETRNKPERPNVDSKEGETCILFHTPSFLSVCTISGSSRRAQLRE
jgi:hypothetical protein